ncbi:glutathione S-transferase family protein [Pigmentiphaga kullae]|uniref:Glutathione S-transferase n=1 Tax=Pigmentiphaga kullae TaxID=151784 RepID=A0A4Q7N845_9BURK|nr:glutathione S-transferase family protein [Pigmentiphaga kullae]RZS78203.1 glutathione S-transferase [Pigmentiphaga kullae]
MLRIWGRRSSFNVQKVLWFAGELGLAYEHIPAGGDHGVVDTPEFRALNPHGRVPVIDDDGTVVWESHTILRYLAARHGAPGFWPADPAVRSQAERWMDWAHTSLQPAFLTGVFWGYYRTPEPLRDLDRIRARIEECAGYFRLLDARLANQPFLGGERLTLADIPAGTALYRYFELDIARPDVPHVQAWYQRLRQRPSYREHVMVPFDELYGRLDY